MRIVSYDHCEVEYKNGDISPTCALIMQQIRWMQQKKRCSDVLLYNYLKHVFTELSKLSAHLERSIALYLHQALPLPVEHFLKKFLVRVPEQLSTTGWRAV